jgi:hypothetical protein
MTNEEEVFTVPEYRELTNAIEETNRQVEEKAKDAVAALFKGFFEKHPKILAIAWTQYTPHFADGDPCEFSVHDFEAATRKPEGEVDEDDDDLGYEFKSSWSLKGPSAEALRSLNRTKSDDIFLAAFGDHARVVATPSGFHVTEYEHS